MDVTELEGDLYFEISPALVGTRVSVRYVFVPAGSIRRNSFTVLPLLRYSDRVWEESNHGPRLIKNRYDGILTHAVDSKEFIWIKLKSTDFRNLAIG